MSDIPSAAVRIQTEQAQFRSAVSESLIQGVGASVNYLLDYKVSNDASISSINGQIASLNSGLYPAINQATKVTNKINWTYFSTTILLDSMYTCPAGKIAHIRVAYDYTTSAGPAYISVFPTPTTFSINLLSAPGTGVTYITYVLFPGEIGRAHV